MEGAVLAYYHISAHGPRLARLALALAAIAVDMLAYFSGDLRNGTMCTEAHAMMTFDLFRGFLIAYAYSCAAFCTDRITLLCLFYFTLKSSSLQSIGHLALVRAPLNMGGLGGSLATCTCNERTVAEPESPLRAVTFKHE